MKLVYIPSEKKFRHKSFETNHFSLRELLESYHRDLIKTVIVCIDKMFSHPRKREDEDEEEILLEYSANAVVSDGAQICRAICKSTFP